MLQVYKKNGLQMIDFQPADGTVSLKAGIYSDAGRNTCGSIYDADTIPIKPPGASVMSRRINQGGVRG
jgi:hypothetical protein